MNISEPNIVYEDGALIAVAKPAGLVVHHDGRTDEPSLSDWILERYPSLRSVGGLHTLDNQRYEPRAGILHRLDRETSGILLIAKDDDTFYAVQRQFLSHSIVKTYLAIVEGRLEGEGVIDLPIGRSRSDFRRFATGDDARGTLRAARTVWRARKTSGTHTLLELLPETGRTHQLRVHMSAIGHPIVADRRYGTPVALGMERVALHAESLKFVHPKRGEMTVSAPIPDDFSAASEAI